MMLFQFTESQVLFCVDVYVPTHVTCITDVANVTTISWYNIRQWRYQNGEMATIAFGL